MLGHIFGGSDLRPNRLRQVVAGHSWVTATRVGRGDHSLRGGTAEDTEARLLHRLRDGLSALQDKLARREPLPALRRGESAPVGKKVLIVHLKGTLLCRT